MMKVKPEHIKVEYIHDGVGDHDTRHELMMNPSPQLDQNSPAIASTHKSRLGGLAAR
jgi:hypothetical protein